MAGPSDCPFSKNVFRHWWKNVGWISGSSQVAEIGRLWAEAEAQGEGTVTRQPPTRRGSSRRSSSMRRLAEEL